MLHKLFGLKYAVETPVQRLLEVSGCSHNFEDDAFLVLGTPELDLARQVLTTLDVPLVDSGIVLPDGRTFFPANPLKDGEDSIGMSAGNTLYRWIAGLLRKRLLVVQKTFSQILAYYEENGELLPSDKPFEDEQLVFELRRVFGELASIGLKSLIKDVQLVWGMSDTPSSLERELERAHSSLHKQIHSITHELEFDGMLALLPVQMVQEINSRAGQAEKMIREREEISIEAESSRALGRLVAHIQQGREFVGLKGWAELKCKGRSIQMGCSGTLFEVMDRMEQDVIEALKAVEENLDFLSDLLAVTDLPSTPGIGSDEWNEVFGFYRELDAESLRSGKLPKLVTLGDIVNEIN